MAVRLPVPGSDDGSWGTLLNDFLKVSHATDGTLKPAAVSAALPGVGDYVGVRVSGFTISDNGFNSISWDAMTATRGDSATWSASALDNIHIAVAGVYSISLTVTWDDSVAIGVGLRLAEIFAECGFTTSDQRAADPVTGVDTIQSLEFTVYLQPGDNVRVFLNQTSGGDITANAKALVTRLA